MTLSGTASTSSLSANALVPVKAKTPWERAKMQRVQMPTIRVWQFFGHKLAELKHVTRAMRRKRLLDAAARGAVSEALEQLTLGVDVNCRNTQGETPLHLASSFGDCKLMAALLEQGAEVDALTSEGLSPLYLACDKNHEKAIELLLANKARVDAEAGDMRGFQPIHVAAKYGFKNVVQILLKHGAKVDAVTKAKELTPLMLAAKTGAAEIVELLLDRGADPDLEDRDGNTPLHFACSGGHYRVTYVLLTAGADPDMPNAQQETPFDVAARNHYPHITRLLETNGMGYSEQPVQAMDTMFATDAQLTASLAQNRPELAEVIIRHRVKYDRYYALGCIVEESA